MQEKLSTANVARLMQYHYEDQSMPVRKAWAAFCYKLRTNTDCDAQFLATKWGVELEVIMLFIIMGRAAHNFDTMTLLGASGDLCSVSWQLRWTDLEVHQKRCPCYAMGSTEVTLENF